MKCERKLSTEKFNDKYRYLGRKEGDVVQMDLPLGGVLEVKYQHKNGGNYKKFAVLDVYAYTQIF